MITLKRNQSLEECLQVIVESAHSRFPVISEDKDHVEGILMAKDLLPFMSSGSEPFSMERCCVRRSWCRKANASTAC